MASTHKLTEITVAPVATSAERDMAVLAKVRTERSCSVDEEIENFAPTVFESFRVPEEWQEIRKAFQENINNGTMKHDKGCVLLLSWEDTMDDLKVESEVKELESVFADLYGFEVSWERLGNRPQHQLNKYLATFMENNDWGNNLLIIYYAGHGLYEDNSVTLRASTSPRSENEKKISHVAWSISENCIACSHADVLVIFDCFEAGGFGGYKVRATPQNVECIAACGVRERTRRSGKDSFTSALIWSLKELHQESPFTSIVLTEKIKTYEHLPNNQNPELLRRNKNSDGPVWIAPLKNGQGSELGTIPKSDHLNPLHEFMDLRFNFGRRVKLEDAIDLAKRLSQLVNDSESFAVKNVTLIDISSTLSNVIWALKMSAVASNKKRKRIYTTSTDTTTQNPDISNDIVPPPARRQRRESIHNVAIQDQIVSEDPLYHFQKFLNCSLQSLSSKIRSLADRVHPPIPEKPKSTINYRFVDTSGGDYVIFHS